MQPDTEAIAAFVKSKAPGRCGSVFSTIAARAASRPRLLLGLKRKPLFDRAAAAYDPSVLRHFVFFYRFFFFPSCFFAVNIFKCFSEFRRHLFPLPPSLPPSAKKYTPPPKNTFFFRLLRSPHRRFRKVRWRDGELHKSGSVHDTIFNLLLPREQTHVGANTGIGVRVKIERAADGRGKPLP